MVISCRYPFPKKGHSSTASPLLGAGVRLRKPERRFVQRTNLQIPLQFRTGAKAGPEWTCQTINVSMQGAYFSAGVAPDVGELVQIFIEIPEQVSGKPTAQYSFTARVIHVDRDQAVVGKVGVGVNFYSYVRVEKSKQRRD